MKILNFINKRKPDIFVLFLTPILASSVSLFLNTNFLITTILFFGLPSIYFSIRSPKEVKKILLFSLLMGIIPSVVIEYVANYNLAWVVTSSVFPRVLEVVSVEIIIWGILIVYFVVSLYEHFFNKTLSSSSFPKRIILLMIVITVAGIFTFIYLYDKRYFDIPYFYFWSGFFLLLIPTLLFIFKYPLILRKFLMLSVYTFIVFITFEITGLIRNQWQYKGEYLFWISFITKRIPFEEFFFFFLILTSSILTYYEYFFDDRE